MISRIFERVSENGRMAVETARCIARFDSMSRLEASSKRRLGEGVEKRLWEVSQIMDQLAFRERTAETEQILHVARHAERLWQDIVKRLGANDDVKDGSRKAA